MNLPTLKFPTLPQLPVDKANHFFWGTVFFCAVFLLLRLPLSSLAALNWATLAVFAAALYKEASDYLANKKAVAAGEASSHEVGIADAIATMAPALIIRFIIHLI